MNRINQEERTSGASPLVRESSPSCYPVENSSATTDILVDGPYIREQPDTERRWIGSRNQRIHFLTPRYSFDDQWRQKNTLEIRVDKDGITVNGFPAADAVG